MKTVDSETIRQTVETRTDEIIQWLKDAVRFPSENRPPEGNEGPFQEFVADECRKIGLELDVFGPEEVPDIQTHPYWLAGRNYGTDRRNVVARWRGSGEGKSVLFSGHADVAPFEPDDWKICRPYEPVLKDSRLYGRGSADMKGGLAAAFWAIRILKELGFQPAGDLLFESVVDEEYAGGNGTLAARLRGHNADLAVVAEPTQMKVCPACFGALLGDLVITGQPGVPYIGQGAPNCATGAARAIQLFDVWEKQWRAENSHPLFKEPGQELSVLLWKINSTRENEFTQLGKPLQVSLSWIIWCHPGLTEDEFFNRFEDFWKEHAASDPALRPFDLKLQKTHHFVRPWETPADHPAVQAVAVALAKSGSGTEVIGFQASCDLAIYGNVGKMPCVLFGPRGDNLHAPDEWVDTKDILTLTETFANLALSWSGKNIGGTDGSRSE